MTGSLLLAILAAPLTGGLIAVVAQASSRRRLAEVAVGMAIGIAAVASITLVLLEGRPGAATRILLGSWFELTVNRRPVVWEFAVSNLILWVPITALLGVLAGSRTATLRDQAAFCVLLSALAGLILSMDLIPVLVCLTVLAIVPLARVSNSASGAGFERARRAGLFGEPLLLGAALVCLAFEINLFSSPATQPAGMPAYLGGMILVGILGRCGLFPGFGWLSTARDWPGPLTVAVLLLFTVPSGVLLLVKCQAALVPTVSRELVEGLASLAAAVGAFVACGQSEPRVRLAYVISAQTAALIAGQGWGFSPELVVTGLAASAIAALILMAEPVGDRLDRLARGLAMASLAGLLPLPGGLHLAGLELTSPFGVTAAGTAVIRWDRAVGLLLTQFLLAAAVPPLASPSPPGLPACGGLTRLGLTVGLLALPVALLWRRVPAPNATAIQIVVLGQILGWSGLALGTAVLRARRPASAVLAPFARLSQSGLNTDRILGGVRALVRWMLVQSDRWSAERTQQVLNTAIRGWTGWIGAVVEELQIDRAQFRVGATLLAVTLFLGCILLMT